MRFPASRQTFSQQADFLSPNSITGKRKSDLNQAITAVGFVVRILQKILWRMGMNLRPDEST
jgi:hypothetical protein